MILDAIYDHIEGFKIIFVIENFGACVDRFFVVSISKIVLHKFRLGPLSRKGWLVLIQSLGMCQCFFPKQIKTLIISNTFQCFHSGIDSRLNIDETGWGFVKICSYYHCDPSWVHPSMLQKRNRTCAYSHRFQEFEPSLQTLEIIDITLEQFWIHSPVGGAE